MYDISAIILFNCEDYLAPASVQSFMQSCDAAAASGLCVERIAIVDRPTQLTQDILTHFESAFDRFEVVDFGDCGASRNEGTRISKGDMLAFFDGDDLWGTDWLKQAVAFGREEQNAGAIYHPEVVYFFSAEDFTRQSRTTEPPKDAKSFYFFHRDSHSCGFDPRTLLLNNIWSANYVAHRKILEAYPYHEVDRSAGFGVEDWMWNTETLVAGIRHATVPGAVHCYRIKDSGALSKQNMRERLLPAVSKYASELERLWKA